MAGKVPDNHALVRHVVGVMTGTSIDGIDAALVRIEGRGVDMNATLIASTSLSLDRLTENLRRAANQHPMTAGEFARLAWDFGKLHVRVLAELIKPGLQIDLICAHGQTVFHQPPASWQLLNPAPIAEWFNCPIVYDLRQADLAHGGQGAPITPLADWVLFRDQHTARAIINLGGFANATILPADRQSGLPVSEILANLQGFDICACNQVLDAVAREALGKPYDIDGQGARSGHAHDESWRELLAILKSQYMRGRSLGTGDEATQWVHAHANHLTPMDLAACAVRAVAECIAVCVNEMKVDEVMLAGGGVRNLALLAAMRSICRCPVRLTDELGIPSYARESVCFAVLGALCADGVRITLATAAGGGPVSGMWCLPRGPAR